MKILIAGGRDFIPQKHHWKWLDELRDHQLLKGIEITEVVNGGAPGADRFAAEWAKERGIEVTWFPAEWEKYGRKAGPLRNGVMADYLQRAYYRGETVAVVLFHGGRGTQSMFDEATKRELTIFDWRERTE